MRSPSLFISSGDPLLDRRFEWSDALLGRGEPQAATELLEETLARAPHFIAGSEHTLCRVPANESSICWTNKPVAPFFDSAGKATVFVASHAFFP